MASERQRDRRRRAREPDRKPLKTRGRHVYVLVAHGIGARDLGRFASQSVAPLVEWVEAAVPGRWHRENCTTACRMADGHHHLRSEGSTPVCVDLEPFYWADHVARPGRVRTAWWVLETGFVLVVLHMITSALAIPQMFNGRPVSAAVIGLPRMIIAIFILFFRTLFIVAVGIPLAVIAALLSAKVAGTLGDALAWTIDDGSQARILKAINTQLSAHKADRTVLIGHSQGGSILTELTRHEGSPHRSALLITLGSGQGILATLSEIRGRGIARWILLTVIYQSWLLGVCIVLYTPMMELLALLVHDASGMVQMGKAFWLMSAAPETSMLILAQLHTGVTKSLAEAILRPYSMPEVNLVTSIHLSSLAHGSRALLLSTRWARPYLRSRAAMSRVSTSLPLTIRWRRYSMSWVSPGACTGWLRLPP
jgi:hypothetical protein